MAQFLIKIVNHFASEIITKRLANSRAFQQLALKTHLKVGVCLAPARGLRWKYKRKQVLLPRLKPSLALMLPLFSAVAFLAVSSATSEWAALRV